MCAIFLETADLRLSHSDVIQIGQPRKPTSGYTILPRELARANNSHGNGNGKTIAA